MTPFFFFFVKGRTGLTAPYLVSKERECYVCVLQWMADQGPGEATCSTGMGGEEVQEEDTSGVDSSFISGEHTDQLINNIERLRLETGYTDLTICIENQRFPCHKVGVGLHQQPVLPLTEGGCYHGLHREPGLPLPQGGCWSASRTSASLATRWMFTWS